MLHHAVNSLGTKRRNAAAHGVHQQALDLVASRLAGAGIIRALEEAGAVTGDDVRIGELLFEFYPVQEELEDEIE